jgi:hypothetical protein
VSFALFALSVIATLAALSPVEVPEMVIVPDTAQVVAAAFEGGNNCAIAANRTALQAIDENLPERLSEFQENIANMSQLT